MLVERQVDLGRVNMALVWDGCLDGGYRNCLPPGRVLLGLHTAYVVHVGIPSPRLYNLHMWAANSEFEDIPPAG